MKKNIVIMIVLLLIVMVTGVNAQDIESTMMVHDSLLITNETPIAVAVDQDLSAKNTFIGETIGLNVIEDFKIDNAVVIEKGSKAFVLVSNVRKAEEWSKGGGIDIQPQYVRTANGVKVPFKQGTKESGGVVPLSLLFTESRAGHDMVTPEGTKVIITVDGDVDLGITAEKLTRAMTGAIKTINKPIICLPKTIHDWTGTWNTNRGKMKLVQVGNRVTGTYERGGGLIDGIVVGDQLVGNWMEQPSVVAPTGAGFFTFTLTPNGRTGIFLWRLSYSNNWVEDKWAARMNGV